MRAARAPPSRPGTLDLTGPSRVFFVTRRHAVVACESPSRDRQNFPAARQSIFSSPATTPGPDRGAHLTTRGNARLGGLSRVSRGHSPRSRPEGLRRGDHAPRQEQRRAGQRRSSEVRVSAFLKPSSMLFFPPNRVFLGRVAPSKPPTASERRTRPVSGGGYRLVTSGRLRPRAIGR